jgi:streptogramin lyase
MHLAKRCAGLLTFALGCVLVGSPAAMAVGLTEYTSLSHDSHPAGIARGADGNVWVAENADPGRIARVTPSGQITEFSAGMTPKSGPQGITPGPDGNVWFTESKRDAIGRITPDGAVTEFSMTPGSEPWDIVAAPDGNLWFTERAGRIGRITPQGAVTEFSAGMPAGARPQGITVGADGNLWFADGSAAAAIGQVTIAGVITVFDATIPAGSAPYDITAGNDGNLWFTLTSTSQVGRITPGGAVSLFPIGRTNAKPVGIALGPDGRAWFAEREGGRIASVGTDGVISEYPSQINGGKAQVTEVTPGPAGTVWFTEEGDGGRVGVLTGVGSSDSTAGLPGSTPGLPGGKVVSGETAGGDNAGDSASTGGESAAAVTTAITELLGGGATDESGWSLPVQGKNVLVGPVTGTIRVRSPRADSSPLLTKLRNIPTGSRIDTSGGVMVMVSALPKKRFQVATFKDGRFDVVQHAKGNGVTDLILRGKTGCGGNGEPDPLLAGASARKAKPTGRRLWASDNHGRYRTHGRDSVATVRGTEWITEDTCDGTLTTVTKGAVSVRNSHTGRRKLVKAGHSFLVRRR